MRDEIISEIRKIRDTHAAKFDCDFEAIAKDWLKEEATARRAGQTFLDLASQAKARRRRSASKA